MQTSPIEARPPAEQPPPEPPRKRLPWVEFDRCIVLARQAAARIVASMDVNTWREASGFTSVRGFYCVCEFFGTDVSDEPDVSVVAVVPIADFDYGDLDPFTFASTSEPIALIAVRPCDGEPAVTITDGVALGFMTTRNDQGEHHAIYVDLIVANKAAEFLSVRERINTEATTRRESAAK